VVLAAGQMLVRPNLPLITAAAFDPGTITPNADGNDDITRVSYSLSRNARVTITLESGDGKVYVFRQDEPRVAMDYSVYFSGVVDGYTVPGETFAGNVLRRLMPDGSYTWRIHAVDESGQSDERTGRLVIQNGDAPLPDLTDFSIAPQIFTPNQDGISDRSEINVFMTKDADLSVYLLSSSGARINMAERRENVEVGKAGRHLFDYEGGVDMGADPPPNGTYTVVAHAQDAVGQEVQRTGTLTIQDGGAPQAAIVPQAVGDPVIFDFKPYETRFLSTRDMLGALIDPPSDPPSLNLTALAMPVGDMLVFRLTVENYGHVPIRTTGPVPGTVYDQDQNAATLGWYDESGAFRVGINCQTATSDYPWRWALGTNDQLTQETDPVSGKTYWYLPAGAQSVVWGAVHLTRIEARNPQTCWAGLIHEDVEITDASVGPREIQLIDPTSGQGS
jgi:hypothetical protein